MILATGIMVERRRAENGAGIVLAVAAEDEVVIRPATTTDHVAIVRLAADALGWGPDDPNEALFRWKHVDNPFGPSPMWVAEIDGRLAAFRTFLLWQFDDHRFGLQRAVRAVDTATHPDFQGRGLFRRLTTHALDDPSIASADFVFNTPNAQSRPGYLKMGWQDIGRVPVAVGVRNPMSLWRVARARVPAEKWSLDCAVGEPAEAAMADEAALDALLQSQPTSPGMRTHRNSEFMRWRYASGPMKYRALLHTERVDDGMVVFRLRQRGAAVEATVGDLLVPDADPRIARSLLRRLQRVARPDYAIGVQREAFRDGLVRLPGQGPRLTWRGLQRSSAPSLEDWDLRLGDIELF